jgi:hypothetical protein
MSTICFLIVEVFGVFICTKKLCIGFQITTNAIFNLNIVQFVIIIINMGNVVSSHFNTLRTGDADLRLYITTVQDG